MTAAAIHWLAPWLLGTTVSSYATIIDREAVARQLDPLLVVALIHHESRFNAQAHNVAGKSWCLLQLRVTRTLHARWYGRERELLRPDVCLRVGLRDLAAWRRYHKRHCVQGVRSARRLSHSFWAHHQNGCRIRDGSGGRRVGATYRALRSRFGGSA